MWHFLYFCMCVYIYIYIYIYIYMCDIRSYYHILFEYQYMVQKKRIKSGSDNGCGTYTYVPRYKSIPM